MNTIAEKWAQFEAKVMAPGAPELQRQEMRIAFYAGAMGLLDIETAIATPEISEDAGTAILQGIHAELQHFASCLRPVGEAGRRGRR